MNKSTLEKQFDLLCEVHGIPLAEHEYTFAPPRRWRFDRVWPDKMVAVEVEGGVFAHGRHNRAIGFIKDCEKYNEAAILGWTVLRFPTPAVTNGSCMATLKRALGIDENQS